MANAMTLRPDAHHTVRLWAIRPGLTLAGLERAWLVVCSCGWELECPTRTNARLEGRAHVGFPLGEDGGSA